MDYNENQEEITLNFVNTLNKGVWRGDTRTCEQGQIIFPGTKITQTANMNQLNNQSATQQPIKGDTIDQPISSPITIPAEIAPVPTNDNQGSNQSNKNSLDNQPIRFNLTNSQPIRLSASSSSDSSDNSKTTWGQVKKTSPKKTKKDSKCHQCPEKSKSPNSSPTKNKNERAMTSWKNMSPSKSNSSSDLEHSNHSSQGHDSSNRIFRFSTSKIKDFSDSTSSSSDADPEMKGQRSSEEPHSEKQADEYSNKENVQVTNQNQGNKCGCSSNKGSPCKKTGSCNCSNNCTSHLPDNQNALVNSNTSLNENDNSSPKKEKGSPDDVCDNEYFYEDDFSVQFDTNLRETSVTPIESDPNTTILDFPNMVTGSYLRFNGGSSNVSFNNSKASSNVSLNNLRVSNIINNEENRVQYDSENSANSGSRNSTMEMSSSDTGRDMMGSSDMIELSDGPLFTPTPSHILSTDSLDRQPRENADAEMSGSNGSGSETNLNVDCCPRKEEYFLSFDGSHSKVSGSETDISLSFTSHDSCPGHWVQSGTSLNSHEGQYCQGQCCEGQGHVDASNEYSSSELQEESTDSFHVCFNKLSPRHKGNQYAGRENLTGRVLKRLVTLKETSPEHGGETSDDENTRTSTTLTAGSKDISSASQQTSLKKRVLKPINEPVSKLKSRGGKSEHLFLVGIGKPVEIMRKASVHSHSLPRAKKLVSWKHVNNYRNGNYSKCQSLPELSTSTSWQNISAMKCRKLSEVSESFHNKRHSASLLEFYQRMKSNSNPVSPDTMNNLEQILWPNFIGQKVKTAEMSDSSGSSQECPHCQGRLQNNGLPDSGTKGYKNKRIFDWLKMDCSGSSKDSHRPNSLACQTGLAPECFTKETLISPQTVTLWCGTKTVGSQFPPATKDCSMQTPVDLLQNQNDAVRFNCCTKKDQALQTSDFEEEEILSILSDNFEEYSFLKSNEGIAKELLSCPNFMYVEKESEAKGTKIQRSKSAEGYRKIDKNVNLTNKSYQEHTSRVGRSKSVGRLGEKSVLQGRRMGMSRHYSHQSLPDIAFLVSSVSLEKEESKDSLFDVMKLDLPVPVTIAPKTELEQFNIYKQKSSPCHHHRQKCGKVTSKSETDIGSSSSGISTSSASSGIDPGYCDCRSRTSESPENDLERLIFFPPHTEEKIKTAKDCCNAKRRAKSLPSRLSECANNGSDPKLNKYANEVRPLAVSSAKGQGQCRISQKWISGVKNQDVEGTENLYALEEEQTPVASPDQPGFYRNRCYETGCQDSDCNHDNTNKCNYFSGEQNFTESDFYRAVESDKIIVVGNEYYRGYSIAGIDSNSSSGSSVPNIDRKPLKSCLRKRNRSLRSTRSMSAADTMALNFDDLEAKVKNHRHSYGCDEVYIVSDEHGQLMMYQADESAEPVMFYLGKDGECHMTEGHRNNLENFGSLANFNIQATDSIHGSDSSTDREGSSKRKSVSFASEVSFQNISPAVSPKKQSNVTGSGNGVENEAGNESEAAEGEQEVMQETEGNDGKGEQEKGDNPKEPANKPSVVESDSQSFASVSSCDPVLPSSSSSSDSAPDVFHVAMDTNDNLWFEDVMLEKIGLLESVSKASDVLIAHFATSTDTFEKLRLGNTTETPVLGDIVITRLCTALTAVLGDGLKHHLAGFQMFGSVQVTVWKVVEASVEIVPQTRSLCDLVQRVKQTSYLSTHQQKFDAFIFGLLNLRVLDFWMSYLCQKEAQLAKFYNTGAILVHSNTTLKKHYDDVITSIQTLAVLPFHLDMAFIKEKALTDSKFKSQEMIGSADGMVTVPANQRDVSESSSNDSLAKARSSVLDFSASKALNWLANAALPKRQTSTEGDMSGSRSRSQTFESTNQNADLSCPANQISGSFSFHGDESEITKPKLLGIEQFSEVRKNTYSDARISSVDSDPIISPSESLRSSQTSQTGFSSLFSTMAARLGENTSNQSLTQSMTSSASSLVTRLTGIKLGSSAQQKTYKKGVTEYNFEEKEAESEPVKEQEVVLKEPKEKNCAEVKMREKKTEVNSEENRNSKRVSFDIVNLFDKLLLPSGKQEKKEVKVTSKIPVPTNRWSWNFSMSKLSSAAQSKVMPKASTDTDIKTKDSSYKNQSRKTAVKSDSSSHKNEHFPKKGNSKNTNGGDASKGSKSATKSHSSKVAAPPKPPRLVQSAQSSGKKTNDAGKKNTATL